MKAAGEATLLVLNLGSATLKAARFACTDTGVPRLEQRVEIRMQPREASPAALLPRVAGELGLAEPPAWIGHRIVHGGDASGARGLDADEFARLQALAPLAPMHQAPALALAKGASRLWPQALQYAMFDTAWHAGLPANARRLPVPRAWESLGVRRYGFHGLAFASAMRILREGAAEAGRGRTVLAHLGGGASLCAVADGRSLDTTMAMTPLEGLPMSTRSGSLDPGALLFLLREGGYSVDRLERSLYRECGLRGLSGISGDVRELLASPAPDARLALDVFALRVAQGIAAMATHLGGLDDLVFSGGIGSRAAPVRTAVVAYLRWLGLALDEAANRRGELRLSPPDARIRIWRVEVDEETEIAAGCNAACSRSAR